MAVKPRVVIGTDHGGFVLKGRIVAYLESRGYEVHDTGVFSADSVDYPDTSRNACREYLGGGYEFGIVLCGTGIGASIAANKIVGIRCALIHDLLTAKMAKAHNDADFIAFGGRVEYHDSVESMIDVFVETTFDGGRHSRRIGKITALENERL